MRFYAALFGVPFQYVNPMKKLLFLLFLLPALLLAQTPDPGFGKYRNTALSSTEVQIKAGNSSMYGFTFVNAAAATTYVKVYDGLASSVVVGTTPPIAVIAVPPAASGVPYTVVFAPGNVPYRFVNNGLTIAAVTGLADNSTGAPATALYVEVLYK